MKIATKNKRQRTNRHPFCPLFLERLLSFSGINNNKYVDKASVVPFEGHNRVCARPPPNWLFVVSDYLACTATEYSFIPHDSCPKTNILTRQSASNMNMTEQATTPRPSNPNRINLFRFGISVAIIIVYLIAVVISISYFLPSSTQNENGSDFATTTDNTGKIHVAQSNNFSAFPNKKTGSATAQTTANPSQQQ